MFHFHYLNAYFALFRLHLKYCVQTLSSSQLGNFFRKWRECKKQQLTWSRSLVLWRTTEESYIVLVGTLLIERGSDTRLRVVKHCVFTPRLPNNRRNRSHAPFKLSMILTGSLGHLSYALLPFHITA